MRIGNKVKKRRELMGLSQSELAQKAGVAQSSIHYIELDQNSPTLETISKIAAALGVTVAELLDEAKAG